MKILVKTYLYYFIGSLISFVSSYLIKFRLGLNHNVFDIKIESEKEVFILGTGQSINDINKSGWKRINNGFSIGINYFLFHNFVPNIIQLELNEGEDSFFFQNLIKIFHAREKEFLSSMILIKSNFHWRNFKKKEIFLRSIPESLKFNIKFCVDYPIPSKNIYEFKLALEHLKTMQCFAKKTNGSVPHLRASIGLTSAICIQNKVKNVYFGGVDLLNRKTFYDKVELNENYSMEFRTEEVNMKHGSDDTNVSEITISEVLKTIKEDSYFSTNFHTFSKASSLRDYLSYVNIN